MSDVTITVTLAIKTCSCGTVYAVPNWVAGQRCPTCADRRYAALQDENDANIEEAIKKDRVIAGLRGALAQRKK